VLLTLGDQDRPSVAAAVHASQGLLQTRFPGSSVTVSTFARGHEMIRRCAPPAPSLRRCCCVLTPRPT
jgi:hypothetical protein